MQRSWQSDHSPDLEAARAQLEEVESRFRCTKPSKGKLEQLARRLASFELLRDRADLLDARSVQVGGGATYRHSPGTFALCLLETRYVVYERPGTRHVDSARQHVALRQERAHSVGIAGLIDLSAPIGRVAIRPETLGDKLAELFAGNEVDFEDHPDFSRRYYVLAKDEELLRDNVRGELLDQLALRDDLHAEANGDRLLVELPGVVQEGSELLPQACGLLADLAVVA